MEKKGVGTQNDCYCQGVKGILEGRPRLGDVDWNPQQKARFGWKPQQVGSSRMTNIQGTELVCLEKWHFNRASTGVHHASTACPTVSQGRGNSIVGRLETAWLAGGRGPEWGIDGERFFPAYGLGAHAQESGPRVWQRGLELCFVVASIWFLWALVGAAALRPDSVNVFCPCPLGFQ